MRSSYLVAFLGACGFSNSSPPNKTDPTIDANLVDAAVIDTPDGYIPDAQVCFGMGFGMTCLPAPPASPLSLPVTNNFDTGGSSCTHVITIGGVETCVLAGTDVTLASGTFRAVGTRPLVIIASEAMTIGGTISVSSIRGQGSGAGSSTAGCATPNAGETDAGGGGGGAGGSFMGRGGNGGVGDTNDNGGQPGTGTGATSLVALTVAPTTIRAGCPGSNGGVGKQPAGPAGTGGGAVYLIARTLIQIDGAVTAGGMGGGNGNDNSGGGGAGSGGLVGLDAPTVTVNGVVAANGGGGGEGGGFEAGGAGTDAMASSMRAPGGAINSNGGNGGAGSGGAVMIGDVGESEVGGGGGGGGGAGYLYVKGVLGGAGAISPPASVF